MGMSSSITKWAARKAGSKAAAVSDAALSRARRARCKARTGRHGGDCGRRIRLGRLADGVTCGREICQLWLLSQDEEATARYLGMSPAQLAEQVNAAIQAG